MCWTTTTTTGGGDDLLALPPHPQTHHPVVVSPPVVVVAMPVPVPTRTFVAPACATTSWPNHNHNHNHNHTNHNPTTTATSPKKAVSFAPRLVHVLEITPTVHVLAETILEDQEPPTESFLEPSTTTTTTSTALRSSKHHLWFTPGELYQFRKDAKQCRRWIKAQHRRERRRRSKQSMHPLQDEEESETSSSDTNSSSSSSSSEDGSDTNTATTNSSTTTSTSTSSPPQDPDHHHGNNVPCIRGLEVRASPQRQRRRLQIARCVVQAQDEYYGLLEQNQHRGTDVFLQQHKEWYLAHVLHEHSTWARTVALEQGRIDYGQAYPHPSTTATPPQGNTRFLGMPGCPDTLDDLPTPRRMLEQALARHAQASPTSVVMIPPSHTNTNTNIYHHPPSNHHHHKRAAAATTEQPPSRQVRGRLI